MSIPNPAKIRAAHAAAELVQSEMVVGLGTGSTATELIRRLGERYSDEGLHFIGVPTSVATAELAASYGIPIRDLDAVEALDLCLDGADEVDSRFRLIKGRGGALLREKIVAASARCRVTIITADKRVERLGSGMPLPVEVSRVGLKHTERRIQDIGARTTLRVNGDGSPYVTDGANAIIDCRFPSIDDPDELETRLNCIVGVFETGLFINMCDRLIVGYPDRVEVIESHVRI